MFYIRGGESDKHEVQIRPKLSNQIVGSLRLLLGFLYFFVSKMCNINRMKIKCCRSKIKLIMKLLAKFPSFGVKANLRSIKLHRLVCRSLVSGREVVRLFESSHCIYCLRRETALLADLLLLVTDLTLNLLSYIV